MAPVRAWLAALSSPLALALTLALAPSLGCERGQSTRTGTPGASAPKGCDTLDACLTAAATAQVDDARVMLTYACEHDSARGCLALSLLHRQFEDPSDDGTAALRSAQRGCALGEQPACVLEGLDLALGEHGAIRDLSAAAEHFRGACEAEVGEGCRHLGTLHAEGAITGEADLAAATEAYARACELEDADACFNAGAIAHAMPTNDGAPDLDVAHRFMASACKAGDEDGCRAAALIEEEIAIRDARIPGANLRVGEASVDGLTLSSLECRVDGGGELLEGLALIGALAKRKAEIDGCGQPGSTVDVFWTCEDGRVASADGAPDDEAAACVAEVIAATVVPFDGSCAATVHLGQ